MGVVRKDLISFGARCALHWCRSDHPCYKLPIIDLLRVTHLIDILGLAQGVLFGLFLVCAHRPGKRPSFLLGLFLILYTLEILPILLEDLGYAEDFASIYWLPVNFCFLTTPLLLLYARKLTGHFSWRTDRWHLLPGVLEFVAFSVMFLLEMTEPGPMLSMDNLDLTLDLYLWGSQLFTILYLIAIIVHLRVHRRRLLDVHSDISGKRLKWLSICAWVMASFTVISFALTLDAFWLPYETYSFVLATLNAIMIYYLSIWGMRQLSFFMPGQELVREPVLIPAPQTAPAKPEVDVKPVGATKLAFSRLTELMEREEPYLDPHLTINDLAKSTGTSVRNLSRVINEEAGIHFNGYVNRYRIRKTKQYLLDPAYDSFSMEGIAQEAGFNSKATFYAAFKRETGLTPTKFKTSHAPGLKG